MIGSYRKYFLYIHTGYVEQNPQYSYIAFLTALPSPAVEQDSFPFNILTTWDVSLPLTSISIDGIGKNCRKPLSAVFLNADEYREKIEMESNCH